MSYPGLQEQTLLPGIVKIVIGWTLMVTMMLSPSDIQITQAIAILRSVHGALNVQVTRANDNN